MGPSGGLHHVDGSRRCSGGRTRTLNNWTRTSRVADYTTPEWVGVQISRAARSRSSALSARAAALYRVRAGGKMPRPGSYGNEPDSEVLGMQRWSVGVIALAGVL